MLTLLLLRHAKALPLTGDGDFARRLAESGEAEAARLGDHLASLRISPSHSLVSPAARTRETYEIVSRHLVAPPRATYETELFSATAGDLRDRLRGVPDAVTILMVVGHNPAIQDLAIMMARDGDGAEIERMRNGYPPCALALLVFDTDSWADARATGGRLDLFLRPCDLLKSD